MEILVYGSFLLSVFVLFLISYLLNSRFFSAVAGILLIMASFWALSDGLQYQSGETREIIGDTHTITYDYSELEYGGSNLSNIFGVVGLLIGIYLILVQILHIWKPEGIRGRAWTS